MRKYLIQTVPYALVKCLSRLSVVSDASWTLYYNAPDSKIKATALTLPGKSAKDIIDVVTNNKPLVDEAFKFASASSSDAYEEESSEQDQEQEEGDDDIEENDNNVLSEQSTRTEEAQ
jgi:ribosomal protein L12E/L44/L45/RPP1/RPP2